jgi:predicted outer membrane repeat protein
VSDNIADSTGGGILNNGTLTLAGSSVNDNKANFGGGIASTGVLFLTDSLVNGNSANAASGGMSAGGTTTVTNSTISRNTASINTGGISVAGTMTLISSTVSGNSAVYDTGGIGNGGMLTLINSTVSGNSADLGAGGGIRNLPSSSNLILTNSTVSGNHAGSNGGGIYSEGKASLQYSTITGNEAQSGGGVRSNEHGFSIANSIVARQIAGGDCTEAFPSILSLGYNLDSDGSCNLTAIGDVPNTNPMLLPLAMSPPGQTMTHVLTPGSPAVDHIPPGINSCGTTVSTDQRGVSRPQSIGCDIGAYELVPGSSQAVGGMVELMSGSSSPGFNRAFLLLMLVPTFIAGASLVAFVRKRSTSSV